MDKTPKPKLAIIKVSFDHRVPHKRQSRNLILSEIAGEKI
jgi:hypothetical protein